MCVGVYNFEPAAAGLLYGGFEGGTRGVVMVEPRVDRGAHVRRRRLRRRRSHKSRAPTRRPFSDPRGQGHTFSNNVIGGAHQTTRTVVLLAPGHRGLVAANGLG